jgi:short-subunit dehydrogenase
MKSALVTGASSGIGEAIALSLLDLNYQVYGVARDFSRSKIEDKNFIQVKLDLCKDDNFPKIENLHILVNSAGVGHFAPHEEISSKAIRQMIDLNLTAPLLLSKHYLRELKKQKGYIININSISGIQPSIFGAAYSATKAGLNHFGKSLFREARKSGLKVININPDITKTPFFDDLNFKYSDNPLSFIEPNDIALIIKDILSLRDGTVITDITIQPQQFQIEKKK